ncbi:spindle and kinetochore-associated protein 1-like isoform X2 [Liolophura sinensis]
MICKTLEELAAHFNSQLASLRLRVELRDAADGDMTQSLLASIQSDVNELAVILRLIRGEISKQKEQIQQTEVIKESIQELNASLRHALDNIPARLPQKQKHSSPEAQQVEIRPTHVDAPPMERWHVQPRQPSVKTKPASFYVQQLDLLTVDEFQSVPKYMRGRITYDQMNNAVEELNKALSAKYKLLGQKRTKLNDANRKKWEVYKSQDIKESTGYFFIVDADVKTYSNLKIDRAFSSLMTILRHCGRIKEIRGGGITRYAVLIA